MGSPKLSTLTDSVINTGRLAGCFLLSLQNLASALILVDCVHNYPSRNYPEFDTDLNSSNLSENLGSVTPRNSEPLKRLARRLIPECSK